MKTRIFFIVIFLAQVFSVYSQNDDFSFVKGRVLDNKTKDPLPFVNIAFINMVDNSQTERISNGTESNVNGEFILYYPKTKQEKLTLVISYLGYEKRILTFPPSNYDLKDIYLSESTSTLNELIFKDKDFGRILVKYVLDNIKTNYPTKAEIYDGFLKEKTAKDSSMRDILYISEAITRNLKAQYTNPLESDVKLLKGRVFKSHEYKEQEHPFKIQEINAIIFLDVLYNRRGIEDAVHSKKTFFEIEKVISLNGKKTYVVKITHKRYKKSYIRLFIQDKTYAVIRGEFLNCCDILPHEYNILFLENEEYKEQLLNSGYSHNFLQFDVEYRQYPDSLWRINYLYYKTHFLFLQYIFSIRKIDLKKSFFAEASYVTTNIYQNLAGNQHLLSEGLKMQEGAVFLESASQKYDSTFWKNYNVVKLTPEEEFLFSQKEIKKDTSPYPMIQKRELELYREKVYVHTDKPYYYQGEPMWFKIYVNYKSPEIRDQLSKTLYVEFISAQKKIIMERVYPIKDGMSFGNWILPDTLSAGNYYLRVYTNFNRNFGDSSLLIRKIPILHIKQKIKKQDISYLKNNYLEIQTGKKTYSPREKIHVNINIPDSIKEKKAFLSVSITDMQQVSRIPQETNILRAYTFGDTIEDSKFVPLKYFSESGITFSGKYLNNKGIPEEQTLTLVDVKTKQSFFVISNKDATFEVQNVVFYDTANFIIQPFGKKKITKGKIILTPRNIPIFSYNIFEPVNIETQKIIEQNIEIENTNNPQRIFSEYEIPKDVRILKEITVEDRKIQNERQKLEEEVLATSTYATKGNLPNYIIPREKIKTQYPNIVYSLIGIPGLIVSPHKGIVGFTRGSSTLFPPPPLIMVDDAPVQYNPYDPDIPESDRNKFGGPNILEIINPNDVEMITVTNRINVLYGSRGLSGVISIYLKKGVRNNNTNENSSDVLSSLEYIKVPGYSLQQSFRMPNYEDEKTDKNLPDFRSTLYWNPNVNTDTTGKVTISFFAADLSTTYRVVVEGITKDNKPVRGEYYIEVR